MSVESENCNLLYKSEHLVLIGNLAVETNSIRTASKVAVKAAKQDSVRGTIAVDGKRYRWSTIQQYEYHGGFTERCA